jgi:EAL domain-containing protein (putative c-di-GMP-specific phosphodiesterase class I)
MIPSSSSASRQQFCSGSIIFREREPSDGAYVIERGLVEISSADPTGTRKVLAVLGPGEMFGEMAALDGTERSATATAVEDTELTLIRSEQLRARVDAAEPVIQLLLRVILNRFRREQGLFRRVGASLEPYLDFSGKIHGSRQAIGKMKLESQLRDALARDELTLFYQPIVRLGSGRLAGYEALLRWRHPQWGLIAPETFIGVAEETALIVPIGRWVLERACSDLLKLQGTARNELVMSVNVSGRQFAEPAFLSELASVIDDTGVNPRCLKLEITEKVLMDHRSAPDSWLLQCKRLGTSIALDDFGTGFSSLSSLASFPIDTLKIDRSFVREMSRDARSLKIVRAINQLAHAIGLDVVAEGIEEQRQRFELQQMRCEYGQGFLFAEPLSLGDAIELTESAPLVPPTLSASTVRDGSAGSLSNLA